MKVAAAIACFPAMALTLYSRQFLLFWLGPEYANEGSVVLSLLATGFLLNSFAQVPYQVLLSTRRADLAGRGMAIYTGVVVTLFVLAIPSFGITGAAGAFLLAQLLCVPWFISRTNHLMGISWGTVLWSAYARVFASTAVAGLVCWISQSWVRSFTSLFIAIMVGGCVYVFTVASIVLDSREKADCRLLIHRWLSWFHRTPAVERV
jgi:O-antigen/teichoic acid export membrane protein